MMLRPYLEESERLALSQARECLQRLVTVTREATLEPFESCVYAFTSSSLGDVEVREFQCVPPTACTEAAADRLVEEGRLLLHLEPSEKVLGVAAALVRTVVGTVRGVQQQQQQSACASGRVVLECQAGDKGERTYWGSVHFGKEGLEAEALRVPLGDGGMTGYGVPLAEHEHEGATSPSSTRGRAVDARSCFTPGFLRDVPGVCAFNSRAAQELDRRVGSYAGVSFDFKGSAMTFVGAPSRRLDLAPQLRLPFLVAGIHDEAAGVFTWGWAARGLPREARRAVGAAMQGSLQGAEANHEIFEAPQVQCDARTALVLAGFIGMHLRHSHGGVYRHCVPEHKKVVYLCVQNEAALDDAELE